MNKFFSVLCLCAFTLSVFAAPTYTAKVKITMSSANSDDKSVTLREAATFSDAYDDGYDSESPNTGGLYVLAANDSKWLKWATSNLEGTRIGLTTGSDETYTFTFTGVVGSTYVLKDNDNLLNPYHPIVEDGTYVFDATPNSTIEDRFVITVIPAPVYAAEVTTNAYGLATFSYSQDVEAVETEVKLYKGAVSGDELALTSVDYVKAGQGVVVYGAANTTYHFNVGNGGTSSFDGNDLLPASAWDLAAQDGYDIYVLSGNMLYLYEGNEMKPNKAFLKLNQNPLAGNAPARIRMVFNSATGVENVEAEAVKAEKFIENGQIFIRRGEAVYNLQGQIVK